MTHTIVSKTVKYVIAISGKEPLAVAWNPDNGVFAPERVEITIETGPIDRIESVVSGYQLRNGKPLKTKWASLRYDLDQFSPSFEVEDQRAPQWLQDIYRELGLIVAVQ